MQHRRAYATLLLLTSQLVAPAVLAQTAPAPTAATPPVVQTGTQPDTATTPQAGTTTDAPAEVSSPGFDESAGEEIVVVGRNIPNVVRATPQIVSVLSEADIARTGDGDIAGALTRVTGLSVVGGGFVYVRGLGDRYSSSLLNGSPLPSPEPLRRSVPLDIFPTSIVGSALVQKTYSVNFPGEFGGGIINLTSKAIPKKNFLSIGGSIAADTATTSELGYVYAGGKTDWLGYDDGTRGVPDFIRNADKGSGIIPAAQVAQLSNARTTLLQVNNQLPANLSGEISGGSVFDIGSDRLGVIASLGLSNTFRTRDATQQDTVSEDGTVRNDFRTILTDNRIVANALVGLGYEFADNTVRWTNVYVHDTLKQGRLAASDKYNNFSGLRVQQNTNWFERQLVETQLVGEFKLTDALKFDARGAFANSKRNAPYERQFDYLCSNRTTNGYPITTIGAPVSTRFNCDGAYQVTQRFSPFSSVVFSELNEDLYTGQADLSYKLPTDRPITLSTGYFYSNTDRTSRRLQFNYQTNDGAGTAPGFPNNLLRPDYLLGPDSLFNACPLRGQNLCTIEMQFSNQNGDYAYDASLEIHAGYAQAEAEVSDGLRAVAGVRFETAKEQVTPIRSNATVLDNSYWLPAGTLTWNFASDMQLRLSGAKTISRPQFRELAPQQFRDPDSDRLFFGNPNLRDSELWNLEARYEWFFGRDQRVTAAGFYKRIDRPIEQAGFYPSPDATLQTGFTYLPKATLWGAEVEAQKYVPLEGLGNFFATRRLLLLANYTYTQSAITADNSCVPNPAAALGSQGIGGCGNGFGRANQLFRDGAPLTGQSDHLVNVQVGLEDTANLSQVTLLFNYASDRVTNRGPSNLSGQGFQPDIVERPGIRLDLVARQGFEVAGANLEVKAEARNLTGTRFSEGQDFGRNTVYINRYDLGRMFSLGVTAQF
ncbi:MULTISPECIES: TonB-dependent receptor domain-containing protein [unclassified Sphingomonas]|uniref:TonB-dependent receptor domain-containing protein n=1 Tax=unclassified Sphingomonas TaxID=196159 RepID=UPI0006F53697|nr:MULTISPECIES: TonB-dependent receptor [unclassified Sphingomonas]KQM66980.1 TonB-dependent receptor [Sphingomonas sp. Leaf16]KQN17926.1 TonB-dependent receptor [Sphingomonas sp. Leaf29]KQN23790.1 TonB-dependent receptor [Sphingomonas sp. Leaf32]